MRGVDKKRVSLYNKTNSWRSNEEKHHSLEVSKFTKNSQRSILSPSNAKKLSTKPTIQAIQKAIKNNDIVYLIGEPRHKKLRTQPIDDRDLIAQAAKTQLFEVRKRHDQMKNKRRAFDNNIRRLKTQQQTYQKKKLSLSQNRLGPENYKQKEQQIKNKEFELQVKNSDKRVYQNIRDRLLHDMLSYKKRKLQAQRQLVLVSKQLESIRLKNNEERGNAFKSYQISQKYLHEISQENYERIEHLTNLQTVLDKRSKAILQGEFRSTHTQMLANQIFQQKEEDQKKWKSVELTHLFLKGFFQAKINKQMEKFFVVQNAFIKIKKKTGITTGEQFVSRYLNKNILYGELLSKVSEKTNLLERLRIQKIKIASILEELQGSRQVRQNIKNEQDQNTKPQQEKQLQKWIKRVKSVKLTQIKLRQWIKKQCDKLNGKVGKGKPLKENFKAFLQILNKSIDQITPLKDQFIQNKSNFASKGRKNQIQLKNTRLEFAREGTAIAFGDDEINNKEESEQINHQRDSVIRKNERFLKDVKRKKFEEKKHMIDKGMQKSKKTQK